MKNGKVFNKQGQLISDLNIYEDPTEWINLIVSTNYFGKPERWVRAKVQAPITDAFEWIYPDGYYDDADVLETEDRPTGQPIIGTDGEPVLDADGMPTREPETWVKLKAEYTIEIEDYNPVPQSITPAQARMALAQLDLLDNVENAIANSPRPVQIYWEYATAFERSNQMLTDMAAGLGITSEQLDDIFRLGQTFR